MLLTGFKSVIVLNEQFLKFPAETPEIAKIFCLSFMVNGRKMWPFFFVTSIRNIKERRKRDVALPVAHSALIWGRPFD